MASVYYGSKGSSVVEVQKQLNKLGANLSVDGIWGKKTEAAYNSYKSYLGDSDSSTSTVNMMKYTPLTDEQIQKAAQTKADTEYDYKISQANQKADYNKYILEQKKEALTPTYDAKEKALQEAYASKREKLAENNLSRGMARSSYASDVQKQSYDNQSDEVMALKAELSSNIKNIDDQISEIQMELLQSSEEISQKKQAAMLSTIESLQKERQTTLTKVLEYNNSLALKLAKLK